MLGPQAGLSMVVHYHREEIVRRDVRRHRWVTISTYASQNVSHTSMGDTGLLTRRAEDSAVQGASLPSVCGVKRKARGEARKAAITTAATAV